MSNYTEQETAMMVGAYLDSPCKETVENLAEELNRSTKSIIGKLSREGVYRREVYVSKTGEAPITKVEIVNNIAECLGIGTENLAGLEKSPKAALKNLEKAVAGSRESEQETFQIKLGTENFDLPVPKWTMTEDPYGEGWDLENDPEYESNVPRRKL